MLASEMSVKWVEKNQGTVLLRLVFDRLAMSDRALQGKGPGKAYKEINTTSSRSLVHWEAGCLPVVLGVL
jgi:hypothetical protein